MKKVNKKEEMEKLRREDKRKRQEKRREEGTHSLSPTNPKREKATNHPKTRKEKPKKRKKKAGR